MFLRLGTNASWVEIHLLFLLDKNIQVGVSSDFLPLADVELFQLRVPDSSRTEASSNSLQKPPIGVAKENENGG